MMMKSKLFLAVVAAMAAQATMAASVDYHGYLRSGSGSASEGGREVCFGLNAPAFGGKVGGAGRLGNECETYSELSFDAALGESNGVGFKLHTMLAFSQEQQKDWEDKSPAWRQTWIEATNVGNGALANAGIWGGKRFYKRHDAHIADFFWSASMGPGAGIENIDFGFGKFSYALMRNDETSSGGSASDAVTNHDFRLEGIGANAGGSIDLTANVVAKNQVDGRNGSNGFAFGITHNQADPFGMAGFNNLVLQVAKDAANLDQSASWLKSTDDKKSWRIVEHLVFDPKNSNWNGALFAGYGAEKFNGVKSKTMSLVVRPVYHFTENYSVALEAGTTSVKPNSAPTQRLSKLTIAPQLSMGKGFWARPALRAYYTYAKWNQAAQTAAVSVANPGGVVSGKGNQFAYATKTSGSSYGVQVEAWW
ncbi:maltoporin [Chitinimonas sp. PSY-7]|uniref:carbohydrate porin n=1 Tax=Chitinimonas sp. PSY-7 TaxID=3459088 RepID=UPI00403FD0C1